MIFPDLIVIVVVIVVLLWNDAQTALVLLLLRSSPLLISLLNGHKEIAFHLLDCHADVNLSFHDGSTPLMAAAYGGGSFFHLTVAPVITFEVVG